ncbi:hypothetical protein GF374_02405 [Candidatus Woesearchaeota archaeon]|nr:hypothetical protein [Candidatus Woesearchaeota archaeon]
MNGEYNQFRAKPKHLQLREKKPDVGAAIKRQISGQIAQVAARIKIVEERLETLRTHIELVDQTLIDKHKSTVSEINDLQDSVRKFKADIDELKDFSERLAKRMENLASKEEVKVIERYVDAWQPLKYIKANELKDAMIPILKELGVKFKKR